MTNTQLYWGDCLKIMDGLIADGVKVDAILCDLPYGTTRNKWDSCIDLSELWNRYKKIIKENGVIALTAQTPFDKVLGCSNLEWLKYEWIWEKRQGTGHLNAKKMPLKAHENILIFYNKRPVYNPQMKEGKPYVCKSGKQSSNYGNQKTVETINNGYRYPTSVLFFPHDKEHLHPTQKPLALMEYLVKTYTNEGDLVLDNCMGSGTTGEACKKLNRNFIGIEIDEKYFEIAKNRIENVEFNLFGE